MLLRHGLRRDAAAAAIEKAVALTIAGGARTRDVARPGDRTLSTREMGDRIVALIRQGESRPVLVS
jgi:3-isopropylmalate dehydrogenase